VTDEAIHPRAAPTVPAAVTYDATQCNTLQELQAWRVGVLDHIQKFVPKPYQAFASKSIENKYQERQAQLESDTVGTSPLTEMASPEVLVSRSDGADLAMPPQSAGTRLRHMLEEVVHCSSKQDLEAWRSRARDVVVEEFPQDLKPFALADVQRHYEIRLADLLNVSTAPSDGRVLAQMLSEVDKCESEPELVVWREHVASHIRSRLPMSFQIPALGDMQMRFERRLDIIKRTAAKAQMHASAIPASGSDYTASFVGFGTFTVVLGGLSLPACMAIIAAFCRARRKVLIPTVCEVETHLMEA